MLGARMMMAAAGRGGLDVADVFSTDLYNGQSQTAVEINNGLDLAGEGGLVWIKCRSNAVNHYLFDTVRGATGSLQSNATNAEDTSGPRLGSFDSDGYTHSDEADNTNLDINETGRTFASWSFRQAANFFDVVTYTGDGVDGRTIPHSLGSSPGMVIYFNRSAPNDRYTRHRSIGTDEVKINTTGAAGNFITDLDEDENNLTIYANVNFSSDDYVAYLFAHDTSDSGIIQCGSYTGNGSSTGPIVTLGWQPQWLLIKNTTTADNWVMHDSARSTSNPRTNILRANSSDVEASTSGDVDFDSDGFQIVDTDNQVNKSGDVYIYMAIKAES